MNAWRIARLLWSLLAAAGCGWVAFCYSAPASQNDIMPSLLLAMLLPAYLAVSMIGRVRPHRSTSPRRHFLLRQSTTDCRKSRHG